MSYGKIAFKQKRMHVPLTTVITKYDGTCIVSSVERVQSLAFVCGQKYCVQLPTMSGLSL